MLPALAAGLSCCTLLGCRTRRAMPDHCLFELVGEHGEALPEVRIDLGGRFSGTAAWVTAAPLGEGAIFQLRPGDPLDRRRRTVPHWVERPHLEIRTLSRTEVYSREGPIGGDWLQQRPGQILKFLLAERHHEVTTDAIAEAIWPDSGMQGAGTVRHFVHALRHVLEPDLGKREPSSFIVAHHGGYKLNLDLMTVDADLFEQDLMDGLRAPDDDEARTARTLLQRAMARYGGEFVSDEPYAQWVQAERNRLRNLACEGLRALARIALRDGQLPVATTYYGQLSELLPYDLSVHRRLIAMLIASGRRSDAARCYDLLRVRMESIFDEELDFDLAEVDAEEAGAP
jgi:DNA-binding SARP family transcriptional activator